MSNRKCINFQLMEYPWWSIPGYYGPSKTMVIHECPPQFTNSIIIHCVYCPIIFRMWCFSVCFQNCPQIDTTSSSWRSNYHLKPSLLGQPHQLEYLPQPQRDRNAYAKQTRIHGNNQRHQSYDLIKFAAAHSNSEISPGVLVVVTSSLFIV